MKAPAARQRILIINDSVTGDVCQDLLEAQPDFIICASVMRASDSFATVSHERPDLVIINNTMPGLSILSLIKDLTVLHPELKILIFSWHAETVLAERAHHAGAKGCIMKNSVNATKIAAVRQVLAGGYYFHALANAGASSGTRPCQVETMPLKQLNAREFEVFRLCGKRRTFKEIAFYFSLSIKLVAVYCDQIQEKLGFDTRTEMNHAAICWVATHG